MWERNVVEQSDVLIVRIFDDSRSYGDGAKRSGLDGLRCVLYSVKDEAAVMELVLDKTHIHYLHSQQDMYNCTHFNSDQDHVSALPLTMPQGKLC